jgi:hypothetical protein
MEISVGSAVGSAVGSVGSAQRGPADVTDRSINSALPQEIVYAVLERTVYGMLDCVTACAHTCRQWYRAARHICGHMKADKCVVPWWLSFYPGVKSIPIGKPRDFRYCAAAGAAYSVDLPLFRWLCETVGVSLPIAHASRDGLLQSSGSCDSAGKPTATHQRFRSQSHDDSVPRDRRLHEGIGNESTPRPAACPVEHTLAFGVAGNVVDASDADAQAWVAYWRTVGIAHRAIEADNTDFLEYVLRRGICPGRHAPFIAAMAGNVHMLEILAAGSTHPDCECCECNPTLGTIVAKRAAGRGHLHVLEWVAAHGIAIGEGAIDAAARFHQLAALRWISEVGGVAPTRYAVCRLVSTSSDDDDYAQSVVDTLDCLLARGHPFKSESQFRSSVLRYAKNERVIDWCLKRYSEDHRDMFRGAARLGNIDVLNYMLYTLGYIPKNSDMLARRPRVRQWLRENVATVDDSACIVANPDSTI